MAFYAYKSLCFRIPQKYMDAIEGFDGDPNMDGDYWVAADDWVTELQADNERLREALENAACALERCRDWMEAEYSESEIELSHSLSVVDADLHVAAFDARATLERKGK